jgi:hypothetical protein
MIPAPARLDGGLKLVGTTTGNVPATAVLNGGKALQVSDSALYVVFL